MTYKVTAIGEDWVELWDGASIVDPDLPSHKSTERVYVGSPNPFQVDDVVAMAVRLVARITPPPEDVPSTWQETAQTWLDLGREDRQVFDQHVGNGSA
jgi:hypothetical protein